MNFIYSVQFRHVTSKILTVYNLECELILEVLEHTVHSSLLLYYFLYSLCHYLEGRKDALCYKFRRLRIGQNIEPCAQTRVAIEMHSLTSGAKRRVFQEVH